MEKYSVFHIEGGMGKNILATSVVYSLKSSDPDRKIILISAWPQVWFNNPDVYQIYPFGQVANFYKNFIQDQDTKIFRIDPYHTEDYILNKKHLIQIWCDLCGVEWNGNPPRLYFSPLELEYIKLKITTNVQKPIFLLHTSGGAGGKNSRPYSWYRDIPLSTAKEVVDYFKSDYHIYQIGYEGQNIIEGCNRLNLETREILAAPLFSRKRLFIDSFSQHASVALGVKSVVCWIGNKPNVLGYNSNINIKPNVDPVYDTYHSSYLDDFDIGGNPVQFPYDTLKIFDSNEIINKIISL
jgi:hypothetical protein